MVICSCDVSDCRGNTKTVVHVMIITKMPKYVCSVAKDITRSASLCFSHKKNGIIETFDNNICI